MNRIKASAFIFRWKTQDLKAPKRTSQTGGQVVGRGPSTVHPVVSVVVCTPSLLARIASYIVGCACVIYILTTQKINSMSEKIYHMEKVG